MRRPSINVTTSSVEVNSTERARRSPTSISKVLMPCTQQFIAMGSQLADDTAYFMRRKPGIHCYGQIVQPELGFHIATADVDMRWFAAFVGIEEGSIRSPAQNCRHFS